MTPSRHPLDLGTLACLTLCAVFTLPARAQHFVLSESQFNQWAHGNARTGTTDPSRFESELTIELSRLHHACTLTPEQAQKLRTAAKLSYQRFDRQASALRRELVGRTFPQNEIQVVYQRVQQLGQGFKDGFFQDDSLFRKVALVTLTDEQRAELAAADGQQAERRHHAQMQLFVAALDRASPMLQSQRQALLELLTTRIRPVKKSTQYDQQIMLLQASKLPKEELAKFLDQAQLECFTQIARRGQGTENLAQQMDLIEFPILLPATESR